MNPFSIFVALLTLEFGGGEKEEKQLPVMGPASSEVTAFDLAKAKAPAETKEQAPNVPPTPESTPALVKVFSLPRKPRFLY